MTVFLSTLHVMACLVLVVAVLLQRGKGAEMGAMLGGGASNTVFGARGAGNFLTKITTACAIIFMVTSLSLSYLSRSGSEDILFGDEAAAAEQSAPGGVLEPVDPSAEPEASPNVLQEIPVPSETAGSEDAPTEPETGDAP